MLVEDSSSCERDVMMGAICVCVLLLGEYCIEGIQGTIGNSTAWLAPKDTTIHSKSSFQVVFFESCKLFSPLQPGASKEVVSGHCGHCCGACPSDGPR